MSGVDGGEAQAGFNSFFRESYGKLHPGSCGTEQLSATFWKEHLNVRRSYGDVLVASIPVRSCGIFPSSLQLLIAVLLANSASVRHWALSPKMFSRCWQVGSSSACWSNSTSQKLK
jgi:hypothetical protein